VRVKIFHHRVTEGTEKQDEMESIERSALSSSAFSAFMV